MFQFLKVEEILLGINAHRHKNILAQLRRFILSVINIFYIGKQKMSFIKVETCMETKLYCVGLNKII